MKVVINRCWGGFGLSDKAIELCVERGMTMVHYKDKNSDSADFVMFDKKKDNYYAHHQDEPEFRCHPIVVKTVEELGEKANGPHSSLDIVEIPFSSCDGWYIHDYDGRESINSNHESQVQH
jgi:antirestriction protein